MLCAFVLILVMVMLCVFVPRAQAKYTECYLELEECNKNVVELRTKIHEVQVQCNSWKEKSKQCERKVCALTETIEDYKAEAIKRNAFIEEIEGKLEKTIEDHKAETNKGNAAIKQLEGQLTRMKHDPVVLSQQLGVSPKSLEKVKRACSNGALMTQAVDECTPTEDQQCYVNRQLRRVSACIGPAVEKLCEMPKFASNKEDGPGVAQLILNKIWRKRKRTSKVGDTRKPGKVRRKLDFKTHRQVLGNDLCEFLADLAQSWRQCPCVLFGIFFDPIPACTHEVTRRRLPWRLCCLHISCM